MPNTVNAERLSDNTIEPSAKLRACVYLKKQTFLKSDSLIKLANCQSRNDVIEKAVDFYFGYITSQLSQEYLCSVLGQKMEGLIGTLGTRISRGNFRYAVELEMLMRMLASVLRISGDDYGKLRKKAIDEVKRTNGNIDILKTIEDINMDAPSGKL